MTKGLNTWESFLLEFAHAFTKPSFALWQALICGWILCPGRHTVTRIIGVIDPSWKHAHDAYHRLLRAGKWTMTVLWRGITLYAVAYLCRGVRVLPIDIDDTLFKKTGRRVEGAGIFRDAVRSTVKKVVYALGLNLVVLTLRITPPWGGVPLGLPINMRLHRKGGPTYIELAEEMVREVAFWLPDRSFNLSGDGAYASLAGRGLPRTHLFSRMRRDAALYEMPPPPTGKRGRPRRRGDRLPSLKQMAQTKEGWELGTVDSRGKPLVQLLLRREVLWYSVCPTRPVLLVIVRDPKGKEPDDFLFTTDLQATGAEVAGQYAGRWSIEDTFRDVKQLLSGEDPQTWKGEGPERAAALSLWLYSAVWIWYIITQNTRPSWPSLPWYKAKCRPSFADALATLRRLLWRIRIYSGSEQASLTKEMVDGIIDVLARSA